MRKNFTLRVTEYWNKLASHCGVSFSGDIQNLLGSNPVQPVTGEPALAAGLDYRIFRGPFHTQLFCDSEFLCLKICV